MKSKLGLWVMAIFFFASVWARAETGEVKILNNGLPQMTYRVLPPGKGRWICRFTLITNLAIEIPGQEKRVEKANLSIRADILKPRPGYVEFKQTDFINSARAYAVKQGWLEDVYLEDFRKKVTISLQNKAGQPELSDATAPKCEKIVEIEIKRTIPGKIGGVVDGKVGAQ